MEYRKLISEVRAEVEKLCLRRKETEDFYQEHIEKVRGFSVYLARVYNADKRIVEPAALLHDISYIKTGNHEEHEIKSAKMAKKILEGELEEARVEAIVKCILNHRGSKASIRESMEERIVASADAMAHISSIDYFLYSAGQRGEDYRQYKEWLRKKLERGWNKITLSKAKQKVRARYRAALVLLRKD